MSGGRLWSDIAKLAKSHVSKGKGISNVLLERLCKKMCSKRFKGVFAANKVPRLLAGLSRFTVIVNLGEVDGGREKLPVGHFVCIAAEPDRVAYIDPYGMPCMQPKVLSFLKDTRRPLWENDRQIQHFDSPYCGLYAVLFTVYFDKEAYEWMRLKFNKRDLMANDKKCVEFIEKLITT